MMKTITTIFGLGLVLLALFLFSCNSMEVDRSIQPIANDDVILQFVHEEPYFESYYAGPLTDQQMMIINGAKQVLQQKARYDTTMSYHPVSYLHGVGYVGGEVYPNGDIDPALGVCTDVTVRALRYAGIVDLQKEIHNHIKQNSSIYPLKRWGTSYADRNIDHRRVPNQHVWFSHNWINLGFSDFQPGDVVIWDLDDDGAGDHIGIISDRLIAGLKPYVIHNSPDAGHTSEGDVLNIEKMVGHYRVKG